MGSDGAARPGVQFVPSPPKRIRIAANGPYKPGGIETIPSQSLDPLDPLSLNEQPPTPEEQQAIANALNTITKGTPEEIKKLQPHNYQNLPEKRRGALLPPDSGGYVSYNLRPNKNRGQERIVVNSSKDRACYTPNHYLSFYAADIEK